MAPSQSSNESSTSNLEYTSEDQSQIGQDESPMQSIEDTPRKKRSRTEFEEQSSIARKKRKTQSTSESDDESSLEPWSPRFPIWSDEDTADLKKTSTAEIALWRRCHKLFDVSPHEILPDGKSFDNAGDHLSVTNLSARICTEASTILSNPTFDLRFFKHAVAVAMHCRLGKRYGRRPKLVADGRNHKIVALMRRNLEWSDDLEEDLEEALDRVLGPDIKHIEFLEHIKTSKAPGASPDGAVARDFTALIRAWDEYQTGRDLKDMATYLKEFANPRGPKKDGSAHTQDALELKKKWIIKHRQEVADRDENSPSPAVQSSHLAVVIPQLSKGSERSTAPQPKPTKPKRLVPSRPLPPRDIPRKRKNQSTEAPRAIPRKHRETQSPEVSRPRDITQKRKNQKETQSPEATSKHRPVSSKGQSTQHTPSTSRPPAKQSSRISISSASPSPAPKSPPRWSDAGTVQQNWPSVKQVQNTLQLEGQAHTAFDFMRGPDGLHLQWNHTVESREDLQALLSKSPRRGQ